MPHKYSILHVPFSEKNCAISEPPAKLSKSWRLGNGLPVASDWPKSAKLSVDPTLGGNAMKDAIYNQVGVLTVAEKLKDALQAALVGKAEFLPFTLVSGKGKPVAGTFWVVNVLEVHDCVDRDKTEGSASSVDPGGYTEIRKLALDEKKLPKEVNILRLAPLPELLVVRDDLRSALESGGFSGIRFLELGAKLDIF